MPFYNAGLKYFLVDIGKDYSIWKLRLESNLQGHDLWLLSSGGTTNAKAKRLLMQHKSDDIIRKAVLADTPVGQPGCCVHGQDDLQNSIHGRQDEDPQTQTR